ncbi:MAG: choice-of-anchor V domain-containing protein [Blastocatellia bacterium]
MYTRKTLLKFSTIGLFGLIAAIYCFTGEPAGAFSAGPPIGRTGAPALGSFAAELTCQGCHSSFPLNSGPGTLTITGLPATYTPGQEVAVTITLNQADRMRYGFEATVLDDLGRRAGDLTVTEATRTRTVDGTGAFAGRQYIQHIAGGIAPNGTNQNSWTFTWKAPAQTVGRVTFYVAGNAANGNGNNASDFIYVTNASVQPATTLPQVATVSAASFSGALASEAIASLFGSNLASGTLPATGLPLPILLGDTRVKVKDNLGMERDAGLFFAGTGQVNFLIPTGTSNGMATITVTRANNPVGAGNVMIDTTAPALFAANANGAGIAAALVARVKASGETTFEAVAQFDQAQNRFVATPIDVGPETDQLFLILFGSGFRGNTMLSAVSCQIGGTNAEVVFTGAVPGLAGLDQANARLPRSLATRGNVNVALTVGGKAANVVSVNVR